MNVYVVTEGKAEKAVYAYWVPLVNPHLSPIDYPDEVDTDNFYIISGMGYPGYFDVISNALDEVNRLQKFDRIVICVDSHEMTKQDKYDEVRASLSQKRCVAAIRIVVQHFCFETWALGNRKIIRPNPASRKLRQYKRLFNVRVKDPELLPPKRDEELSRVTFALRYLRLALNDRFRNLTYTKRNPQPLLHDNYFAQVKNRLAETGHLGSFADFLTAFV